MKHKTTNYISAFILGGIAGGAITLLYAPFSGKELRARIDSNVDNYLKKTKLKEEEIILKAKTTADDILVKTIRLSALIEKYAGGICEESCGKIENEIRSLKAAIKAAVDTYRDGNTNSSRIRSTRELVEDIFSDYDNVVLPKS